MFCKNCWATEILHDPKPGEAKLYRCSRCDSRDIDETITKSTLKSEYESDEERQKLQAEAYEAKRNHARDVGLANDSLRVAVTSLGSRVAELEAQLELVHACNGGLKRERDIVNHRNEELEAVIERVRKLVAEAYDPHRYNWTAGDLADDIKLALPPEDE